jgi:hypothetical protein
VAGLPHVTRQTSPDAVFDPRQQPRRFFRKHCHQFAQQVPIMVYAAPQRFGIEMLAFQSGWTLASHSSTKRLSAKSISDEQILGTFEKPEGMI